MTRDKARDDKYFNCSQVHEDTYVKNLYTDPDAVSAWLVKACKDGTISYISHKDLYKKLAAAGFTKK